MTVTLDHLRPGPADPDLGLSGPLLPRLLGGPADPVAPSGPSLRSADLVDEIDRAGLRGRGGAGFPTAVKLRAVLASAAASGRRPVVVANGSEGEPLSRKDTVLLTSRPHLVIDGLVVAAAALGADRAVLCLKAGSSARGPVEQALAARAGSDPVAVEVVAVPPAYATGEESALVDLLNGGPGRPTVTPPRPAERGVGGRPTLVDNVETLAAAGLVVRHGAGWWRQVGTDEEPGSMLVTVAGAVDRPGVAEVAVGAPLADVLAQAGAARPAGVLVGGYFGTWLTGAQAEAARLSRAGLAPFGASPGCGVVAVVPETACPLAELARVAGWLAGESAGQCGPCANGLPALAGAVRQLVGGDPDGQAEHLVDRWSAMVAGRGACRLPDGAVQFVRSGLAAFAGHLEDHRRGIACPGFAAPAVLPTPDRLSPARLTPAPLSLGRPGPARRLR